MTIARDRFLQAFAAIYLFAFSSLYIQYRGLYGRDGLEPIEIYTQQNPTSLIPTVTDLPMELLMELYCLIGISVATSCIWCRMMRTIVVYFILWFLYLSLYQVGQTFLSFQWDLLLLETGFLAMWLARPPWVSEDLFQPSQAIVWCLRYLLFKLMFMAGVIKFQSQCPTWLNLTALEFHYATQCIPTPLAWYAHQLPPFVQKFSVAATFWIEYPAAFLLIVPWRAVRELGVGLQIWLQICIVFTGNYTFFNLLTMLLCFAVLDPPSPDRRRLIDGFFRIVFVAYLIAAWILMFELDGIEIKFRLTSKELEASVAPMMKAGIVLTCVLLVMSTMKQIGLAAFKTPGRFLTVLYVLYLVLCAGIGGMVFVVSTLTFSTVDRSVQTQIPPFVYSLYHATSEYHIAHPYGLFRRMTGVGETTIDGASTPVSIVARPELIIEGTSDGVTWEPYHFKYKPGDVSVRGYPNHSSLLQGVACFDSGFCCATSASIRLANVVCGPRDISREPLVDSPC